MNKTILMTATLFGMVAIILGAFGAHGLEKIVNETSLESFETGVRYQMYHALFLLFLGIWDGLGVKPRKLIFRFIWIGTVLFSFSIYALTLNDLTSFDFKIIGFVTPMGGSILIVGWALLGFYILSKKSDN